MGSADRRDARADFVRPESVQGAGDGVSAGGIHLLAELIVDGAKALHRGWRRLRGT